VLRWTLASSVAASALCPDRARQFVLRLGGATVGQARIRAGLRVTSPLLTMGSGVFINNDCRITNRARVTLMDRVTMAPGVLIVSGTHELGPSRRRAGRLKAEPVVIGEGAWLGAGCVILPGVTVADGCVIGAGAVVTRSTEPDGLYVGVPAVRVRDLPAEGEEGR
jgi:maltose O-acetyltransferase